MTITMVLCTTTCTLLLRGELAPFMKHVPCAVSQALVVRHETRMRDELKPL